MRRLPAARAGEEKELRMAAGAKQSARAPCLGTQGVCRDGVSGLAYFSRKRELIRGVSRVAAGRQVRVEGVSGADRGSICNFREFVNEGRLGPDLRDGNASRRSDR